MTNRLLFLIGFTLCTSLIATALYFQYQAELEPCPLCIFQRIAFIVMGVFFLCGVLHNSRIMRKIYAAAAAVSGIFGIAIAARHVWLQTLPPDQVPECGPGLEFMLDVMPFKKMLETVLRGSGECAEVAWTFAAISMPGWSLIWLVLLTMLAISLLIRREW